MGSIRELPSGRYQARYRDSQNRERSAGVYDHKKQAAAKADEAERKARGTYWRDVDAGRKPWGAWADEGWLPARVVAASTEKGDTYRLENHLRPKWGRTPVAAITRTDIKTWAAELRRSGMGPETVRRCVHLLSASLVAAVDAEIIDSNPAARLKLPSGGTDTERYLTRDEYSTLRQLMPTPNDQLIADMLVYTGLRWGELAGLHRPRLDTGRQMMRVVETYDEASGKIKAHPKGGKARDVPLTPELVAQIDRMPATGRTCGVEHETGRCPGPLLLTTEQGKVLRNSNWASRVWVPAVRDSGIGHTRIHDMRHTYASWLLQKGIPLAEVGRLLGHVSSITTQRYAHLAEMPSAAILAALAGEPAARLRHDEADDS